MFPVIFPAVGVNKGKGKSTVMIPAFVIGELVTTNPVELDNPTDVTVPGISV